FAVGYKYSVPLDKWSLSDLAVDFLYAGDTPIAFDIPGTLGIIYNAETWKQHSEMPRTYPLFCGEEFFSATRQSAVLNFVSVDILVLDNDFIERIGLAKNVCLVFDVSGQQTMLVLRRMGIELMQRGNRTPFIIKTNYTALSEAEFQLHSSTDAGALLIDGFGDGIWIRQKDCVSSQACNSTAFGILQATRTRISKTEYISCPSCGRTLFDLQETTQKIRERTDHLK